MKKFLKIFGIILTVIFGLAIIIGGLYYVSFFTNLWQKYPALLKAQVAYSRLEIKDYETFICHEDCMYEKEFYRQTIADYLVDKKVSNVLASNLKKDFFNENQPEKFREDLVKILKIIENKKKENKVNYEIKAPDFLADYLVLKDGDQNIKSVILDNFGDEDALAINALNSFSDKATNKNLSLEERIPAIDNLGYIVGKKLSNFDYSPVCSSLLGITEEKGSPKIRYAALNEMPYCLAIKGIYTKDIFNKFQALLFDEPNNNPLQGMLAHDLALYGDIDKNKTIEIMRRIYADNNLSKMAKEVSTGYLIENNLKGYIMPEITKEEDDLYASQIDDVWYFNK